MDEMVDVSELKEVEKDIREINPVHVTGRVDFGSGKFTFHLHITGSMVLPCSRSLVDVTLPLTLKQLRCSKLHKKNLKPKLKFIV